MKELLRTRRVMPVILALGLFAMGARTATDPDLWWHLRTGQLILQNHAVFHTDPFSYTRFGQPWINHEWLSDVLMFAWFHATGWAGLIAGFAAVIAAVFYLAYIRCSGECYVAALFTVWAALASAPLCAARPQMFSLLMVSLLLLILERSSSRPVLLWSVPALMLIWINLHAGFLAGFALIALFTVGESLDWAFGSPSPQEIQPRLQQLGLTLGASLAVVPLNPYGWRMYGYPISILRSQAMQKHIAEWFSPDFHQPQYLPILLMALATLAVLGVSPYRLRPREILLFAATLFAGLVSVRHLPIFALVAVPILADGTQAFIASVARPTAKSSDEPAPPPNAKLVTNLALLACMAAFAAFWFHTVARRQVQAEARVFPVAATSFLISHHLPTPIFNDYDWGGYLIWRAYPQYPVFIDGRADVYGDAFMDSYSDTYSLHADWQATLEHWQARTVMVPPNAALLSGLQLLPAWKEVYRDSQAVILVRR